MTIQGEFERMEHFLGYLFYHMKYRSTYPAAGVCVCVFVCVCVCVESGGERERERSVLHVTQQSFSLSISSKTHFQKALSPSSSLPVLFALSFRFTPSLSPVFSFCIRLYQRLFLGSFWPSVYSYSIHG